MRPVSNTFFICFQLTTLFNKIIPAYFRSRVQREIFAIAIGKTGNLINPAVLARNRHLFAQAKALDQRTITIGAAALKVIKQLAAPAHHTQ